MDTDTFVGNLPKNHRNMEQGIPTGQPNTPAVPEDKTVAILAYITLIGFIIAIVLHGQKKTALGAFHLRQMLGIFLTGSPRGSSS